ncbi:serine/threonine protein kinase [bacterium]|nr:serine/threonine protein kinase [bacterium]
MAAPENRPDNYVYKPGDIVGESYVLTSLLAKGGMGVVFKARHLQLEKVYALKLLTPLQTTSANWRRFELEAKTLAKLEHRNVVQIFNMGVDARGCPYYVMELLQGQSMAEALDSQSPLAVPQFIQSFLDVCSALKLAHSKGIVHRDIKPSNLILVDSNLPLRPTKVVDFGIARLLGVEGQSTQNLTLPGEIFGSPLYMSPEQTLGLPVTMSSDIYSLGCTMFEAFTGSPPFKGPTALSTMMMHQVDAMPEILREDCTDREFDVIEQMIAKCMEKKASDRFENVGDIFDLLDSLSRDQRPLEMQRRSGSANSPSVAAKPRAERFSDVGSVRERAISERALAGTGEQTTGRVSRGNRNTVYAIALAMVIGLGTMGALAWILTQQNRSKVVMPTNAAMTRHITGDRALPPFDIPSEPTSAFVDQKKKVSRLVSRKGRSWREFDFPTGEPVGSICVNGINKQPAIGHMICHNDKPVAFDATDVLRDAPQFYARFDDRALCSLLVKESDHPPTIATLAGWKNLTALSFEKCNLENSYLRDFGKLKHLKILGLLHCDVSAAPLAESGVLPRLNWLQLVGVSQSEKILKALERSKNIKNLAVRWVELNEQELASIATLTQLEDLDLRTSHLPSTTMETLSHLPHLRGVHLNDARFEASTLTRLLKCKTLAFIDLENAVLPSGLVAQMKAARPDLQINEVKN